MRVNRHTRHQIAVLSFLILVGVVSIFGKLTAIPMGIAPQDMHVEAPFAGLGLAPLDRRALSKDGTYTLTRFARPPCNGVLNVVALQRNAEGAGLLAKAAPNARVRFILNGTVYETFPTIEFWLARLGYAVGRSLGRSPAPPLLAAFSELGNCALSPSSP